MVRIPAEYQEVEYIESTGGQYIDTGYYPNNTTKTSCDFLVPRSNNNPVFGCRDGAGVGLSDFDVIAYDTGRYGLIVRFNSQNQNSGSLQPNWIYSLNIESGRFSLNDTVFSTYEPDAFQCEKKSLTLFARNLHNGLVLGAVRFYYFKIWNENTLAFNLIPCYRKSDNEIGMYDTVTGTFFTNQGTGTFLKGNDVTYDPISLLETRRRILLNTPHIESVSGSIATFNTDLSANLTDMKIHFHPVQEGTGDPSPDNVRPITGWDGVTVTRCGKNLFDFSAIQWTNGYYLGNITNCDGKAKSAGSYKVSEFVLCSYLANQTITIGFMANAGAQNYVSCCFYTDANEDSYIEDAFITYGRRATGLTVPSNAKYMRFSMLRSASTDSQWFGLKSQIDSYEPYTVLEIPISFPKTIYGGYVDLVKGEVVEEWTMANVPTNDVRGKGLTGYNRELSTERYFMISIGSKGVNTAIISNMAIKGNFREDNQITRIGPDGTALIHYALPNNVVGILSTDTPDERNSKIIDWLSDNQMVVVYDIKTPNTYPLTPQTIKVLKGINNIWSDANGNIEVKFWKH